MVPITSALMALALAAQFGASPARSVSPVAAGSPDPALVAAAREALAGVPYAASLGDAELYWVESTLRSLPLRRRAAQLVFPYLEGGEPSPGTARWRRARRLAVEDGVGGFIVGAGPAHGTVSWLGQLQRWSGVPPLMTADLEWGPGTRLRGATLLPVNMAIAAAGPASLAYEAGRITGLEARAAGIHATYAPVADVNVNPRNPVINTRSYGSDAALVSERVVEFVRGARSAGLLTVAKHFPGHGDTEVDSHVALPVLGVDRWRLDAVELAPFRAAVAAGVDGVMTAHVAVPALDPAGGILPATLSSPIVTGVLRGELGFGGLVVTDALHMDGVRGHGRPGEVAVAALEAGADVLLQPPNETEAIDAVVRAVRQGRLTESRLDASVRRVLAAKAAVGLVAGPGAVALRPPEPDREPHEAWSRSVAERSLTLVRARPGALPLPLAGRSVVAVIYDDRTNHRWGEELASELEARGARVEAVRLTRRSDAAELARTRGLATRADHVLVASFTRAIPWRGELGLPAPVAALANELTAAGGVLLSFGDPYLLRQVPDAGSYLVAWSETATSQRAVARALAGEVPIAGRLPIDLPPRYPVGHGLVLPSLPGVTTSRR